MTKTGVMVHYVIPDVDLGQAIVWEEVEKKQGESLEALETRMSVLSSPGFLSRLILTSGSGIRSSIGSS